MTSTQTDDRQMTSTQTDDKHTDRRQTQTNRQTTDRLQKHRLQTADRTFFSIIHYTTVYNSLFSTFLNFTLFLCSSCFFSFI